MHLAAELALDRKARLVPFEHPALEITHMLKAQSSEYRGSGTAADTGAAYGDDFAILRGSSSLPCCGVRFERHQAAAVKVP